MAEASGSCLTSDDGCTGDARNVFVTGAHLLHVRLSNVNTNASWHYILHPSQLVPFVYERYRMCGFNVSFVCQSRPASVFQRVIAGEE
jgi:hypothetical protein